MTGTKKAAKTKPGKKKAGSNTFTWTINADGSFTMTPPGGGIANGDLIEIVAPDDVGFDIKVKIKVMPIGGGGGPIIIHS